MKKPLAIYAGSFDPWTNGHQDILVKANKVFNVIVVVANNLQKKHMYSLEKRMSMIQAAVPDDVQVIECEGLVAAYAKEKDIQYSIRGLRNFMDYGYEENIANINTEIFPLLETVYFRPSLNCAHISSTFVRELLRVGADVKKYIPYEFGYLY